ncbi:Ferric-chelate reductase 1 [Anabarilius grahami]|uniref:Ferric-chelate reductase 1 n=1 Tax=Anabarilius grahami TaxID=495550 RepID=A0A3N0YPI7_ANAGA|nr:Ferric-chelate reductase 1 [Anabarilius grahami]
MFLYVLLSCVGIVQCFRTGQVSGACGSMTPGHGSNSAQSSSAPYTVTANRTTFIEGDEITVSLSAQSGDFEGFLLRANQIGSNNPIGTFTVLDNGTQALSCDGVAVPSNPDCGKTKVCFSQPSNCDPTTSTGCYFMAVQASSDQSEMTIEMFGQADGYVAIGFSDDQQMGNDDIYICGKDSSGLLQVQHAFSTGRSRPNILSLGNVTNIKTALTNGNINCSFTSRNAISTASRATSTSEYYLMIASGPSSEGNIQFHTTKYVSSTKADILNPSLVTGSAEEFPAILKAHGALMLIAWMTTGSIGMIIARYLKGVAKGHGFGGKDFWFMAHVSLMALSVTATAIAFILVFSHVRDWSGGAHPVLGCLVMILSLIQPIVAAFRCEPQHERRFVFNWAHSFIALGIKALAVAAIFTGLALFEQYKEDGWMLKVMGGFITWEALMYILQDLNMRAKKKVLLILFLMGNLAFLISLLVGIGRS